MSLALSTPALVGEHLLVFGYVARHFDVLEYLPVVARFRKPRVGVLDAIGRRRQPLLPSESGTVSALSHVQDQAGPAVVVVRGPLAWSGPRDAVPHCQNQGRGVDDFGSPTGGQIILVGRGAFGTMTSACGGLRPGRAG